MGTGAGAKAFAIADASPSASGAHVSWAGAGLSWSAGDTVPLKLTGPPAATDTTRPTVTANRTGYFSNAAGTTALAGPLKAGANIYTRVTFSEAMKHVKSDEAAARPELFRRIGSTDVQYDIQNHGETLKSGVCQAVDLAYETYVCLYTVGASDNGAFRVKAGANSVDRAGNALAEAYTHAAALTLDTADPAIAFPDGVTPTVGTAATVTLTDAGSKIAKHAVVEVDGTATDATGCDDPGAGGDDFSTTAVDPAASPETVDYTPVTAGKKICVYAEDAAGNSDSELWTTAIQAANVAATGKPAITGTGTVGETLTAAKARSPIPTA